MVKYSPAIAARITRKLVLNGEVTRTTSLYLLIKVQIKKHQCYLVA